MATPCNGTAFAENKNCSRCQYGANGTRARQQCPPGSYAVDECTSGLNEVDRSRCSTCINTCKAANYSKGENGQYIAKLCGSADGTSNTCGNCDGPCAPYESPQKPGQYISSFCTGFTTSNRQCMDCRTSCPSR